MINKLKMEGGLRLVLVFLASVVFGSEVDAQVETDWQYRIECGEPTVFSSNYSKVELPIYVGGYESLISQVQKNTVYPTCALEYKVSGFVNISFVVNSKGEVSKVKSFYAPNKCLETAAYDGVKISLKNFIKPAMFEGQPISIVLKITVTFRMNGMEIGSCIHSEADAFSKQAYRAFKQNNYMNAAEFYTQSIQRDTTYFLYYLGRGKSYYELGEMDKALLDIMASLSLSHNNHSESFMYAGLIYHSTDNLNEALIYFEEAIKLDKSLYKAFLGKGKVLLELGKMELAEKALIKALKKHHTPTEAHYYLGMIHFANKDFAKAIEKYRRVLITQPKNGKIYYYKGMAHARLRDMNAACIDWTKARELGVKDAELLVETQCSGK